MSDLKYLEEEKSILEGQIELVEEYEKFKDEPDYDKFYRAEGLIDFFESLNNLEIKFGKAFLKKRIASLETRIEEEIKTRIEKERI